MEFLATKSGKIIAFLAILLLVVLIVLASHGSTFASTALQILVLTLAACVGLEFGHRAWTRRRQRRFDAEVAAKEGIADRRKEWAGWTTELRHQKINRYELPMFLLVGEPQSGKSVMLQKSDLHFPLGQHKLSGVGGTRGCDWWFTDEAVVLDLAGRLFTHEGGASDEAEWAAFLELLVDYRPQCPANGVILVLPCDGLLKDTEAQQSAKAGRMQAALVTLTNKLEARLPVHVVLTKADKIFGFAECVHALETEKRHEMFGWSRSSEKAESPYEEAETSQAFVGLVARARILRAQVMASTPVPEGIAQLDRAYAFPEELTALWPALAGYLRRIFGETRLVDRLFFRGFHLTCGLQSGAPIAKACADLVGATGEADRRALDALFSKEKAFFIKDLIRKRVFQERALVRPTRARAQRARRTSILAYGLSAVVAALAVLGSGLFAVRASAAHNTPEFTSALKAAKAPPVSESELLDALHKSEVAIQAAPTSAEGSMIGSARNGLESLYAALFDRLVPILRGRIEAGFREKREPRSYEEFKLVLKDAHRLLEGWEVREESVRERLLQYMDPPGASPGTGQAGSSLDSNEALRLLKLRDRYGGNPVTSLPSRDARQRLADRTQQLWEGVLTPGCAWQVRCHLGYVLACKGVRESSEKLDSASSESVHELCRTFSSAKDALDESEKALFKDSTGAYWVLDSAAKQELKELEGSFDDFYAQLTDVKKPAWEHLKLAKDSIASAFSGSQPMTVSLLDQARRWVSECPLPLEGEVHAIQAPMQDIKDVRTDAALKQVCARGFLANEAERQVAPWTPQSLLGDLESFSAEKAGASSEGARNVFLKKCTAIRAEYARRYPNLSELRADIGNAQGSPYSPELTDHLARMQAALSVHKKGELDAWARNVSQLIDEYEDDLSREWKGSTQDQATSITQFGTVLRRFSGKAAPSSDKHKGWTSMVEEWVVGACTPRIDAFARAWNPGRALDSTDPGQAAGQFLASTETEQLRTRLQAADPHQKALLEALEALPAELKRAHEVSTRLRAACAVRTAEDLAGDPYVKALRGIAVSVQKDAGSGARGEISKRFSSAAEVPFPLQPDGGITYVASLFEQFKDCALGSERKAFLEDFADLLGGPTGTNWNLVKSAWGSSSGASADLAKAFVNFFGAGNGLDRLLEKYGIKHSKPGATSASASGTIDSFRPQDRNTNQENSWKGIVFLVRLQEYLQTAAKSGDLAQLSLTLTPFDGLVEEDPTWKTDLHAYFYFRTRQSDTWSQVGHAKTAKILSVPKLELRPGSTSFEGVFLRWSERTSSAEHDGDYVLEWKGPFAGFLRLWDADPGATEVMVHPGNAKSDVQFKFKIGLAPPGFPPREPSSFPF